MNFWKKFLRVSFPIQQFFSPGLNKSKIEIYKGKTSEVSKDFDIVKGSRVIVLYKYSRGEGY